MTATDASWATARGARLAGVLEAPAGAAPPAGFPAVLLCQGLSGVKHLVLPQIAAAFAARGIVSLRFDYSGYGDSEGEPGWIDPQARIDDALSAFAWLSGHDDVDAARIGVYGHSYGGPVAISLAAREPRAGAVVSVSGPGDGREMLRAVRASWDWVAFRRRLAAERAAIAGGAAPTVVPVTDILPFSPAFMAAYAKLKAEQGGTSAQEAGSGLGVSTFHLASADAMMALDVTGAAARLGGRPLLLVHGADDDTAPIETVETVYAAAPGPKRWVVIPGAAHNDLDAGPGLTEAVGLAGDWFEQHLPAR